MTVIGYDSDIVTAESADEEEQDEEEDEYVFSLCWSVTVWITFEDNVCIFSVFVTGDNDDVDEEKRVISVWLSVTVRRVRSYNLRTIFLGN